MSNEIRTRRLLVTLPDVSGEESDEAIGYLLGACQAYTQPDATVEHLLDEAPIPSAILSVKVPREVPNTVSLNVPWGSAALDSGQARKAAALLLRAADEAEGRA